MDDGSRRLRMKKRLFWVINSNKEILKYQLCRFATSRRLRCRLNSPGLREFFYNSSVNFLLASKGNRVLLSTWRKCLGVSKSEIHDRRGSIRSSTASDFSVERFRSLGEQQTFLVLDPVHNDSTIGPKQKVTFESV